MHKRKSPQGPSGLDTRPALLPRFLILIVVVVSVGALIGNIYVIAFYQHPEVRLTLVFCS